LDQTLTTQYTLVRDVSWPATDAPCEFTMGYRIYTMR
jgi:hypothetical protein